MLRVCKAMGVIFSAECTQYRGEPTADLLMQSSLHGTTVEGEIIPTLIDEIPMIAVMQLCRGDYCYQGRTGAEGKELIIAVVKKG